MMWKSNSHCNTNSCILVTCTSVLFPEFAQHSAMRAQALVSLSQHALTPGIHTSFSLVSVRCPVISDFIESFLGGLSKRVFPLLCSPVPSSYPELRTTSDSILYVYISLLLPLHQNINYSLSEIIVCSLMYPQDLNSETPNEYSKRHLLSVLTFLIYREHLSFFLSLKQSNHILYIVRWCEYYPIEIFHDLFLIFLQKMYGIK